LKHLTTFGASSYAVDDLELMRDLDDARIAALLAHCPVLAAVQGDTLDHAPARLYIVLRGAVGILADSQTGGPGEPLSRVLPGECVGELSVLDDEAAPTPARALQDSELLAIDAQTLWRLVDECNGVARNLLRLMSFRVRAANAQSRRRQKVGEFYRQMSMADGLTGLYNRAWLNDCLPALVEQAGAAHPLSVVLIDLDHFKQFNDTYGHLAGDDALRTAARVLAGALRPSDFAARYGGEELIVVLPDTGPDVAQRVAQRLCERLREAVVLADMRRPLPHVTASFGVACLQPGQQVTDLVAAADAALYRAKHAGRNQVAV
jgi:diguanylate cyclase (GGDEF)-like protein